MSGSVRMKAGLIGCGNIGGDLCRFAQESDVAVDIVSVTDADAERAASLVEKYALSAKIGSIEETVAAADFVVECAHPDAVGPLLEAAMRYGRPCLVMSVGGLLRNAELVSRARAAGVRIQIPSGAICGLDGLRAAREAGLTSVTLTTRKPPSGLKGAPYLVERGIVVDGLTEALVVFEGNALEAVKAFPQNVNVAAALSLAGIGPELTRVRVVADPAATSNTHEIAAEGAFGRMQTVTQNMPSPRNPKSSYLASLSACAELRAAAAGFSAQ